MSKKFNFTAKLDQSSLKRISHLAGFRPAYEASMSVAMLESVTMLHEDIDTYMLKKFKNPHGSDGLQGTVMNRVESWNRAWVGTYSPYGRRRNYGFRGMVDSLGRFYLNDKGILWAENTLQKDKKKINMLFYNSLMHLVLKMEGTI